MTRIAALLATALLTQGCAAIPVAVAVGAMGVVPGNNDEAGDTGAAAEAVESRDEPAADIAPAPAAAVVPASPGGLPSLGPLPAQALAEGECALFLFTRAEPSQFVAFAAADGGSLILNLDGAVTDLSGTAPIGEIADTFEQTYRAGALEARLTATLAEPLPQGRRAPQAALRLVAADGAAQVTPLSGLVACEGAPD